MKKFGGTIGNWQIHNLSCTEDQLNTVFPNQNAKPMVMSGTVIEDPIGRWKPGNHMKSSLIVRLDREKGEIETLNTIYKLAGEEGKDILPDLGDAILNVFY